MADVGVRPIQQCVDSFVTDEEINSWARRFVDSTIEMWGTDTDELYKIALEFRQKVNLVTTNCQPFSTSTALFSLRGRLEVAVKKELENRKETPQEYLETNKELTKKFGHPIYFSLLFSILADEMSGSPYETLCDLFGFDYRLKTSLGWDSLFNVSVPQNVVRDKKLEMDRAQGVFVKYYFFPPDSYYPDGSSSEEVPISTIVREVHIKQPTWDKKIYLLYNPKARRQEILFKPPKYFNRMYADETRPIDNCDASQAPPTTRDFVNNGEVQNYFSPADDERFGDEYFDSQLAEIRKQGRSLDAAAGAAEFALIKEMVRKIGEASDHPDFHYKVHIADLGVADAWCGAGGRILVSTGLWDAAAGLVRRASEGEIAAVIAHEVGHAVARHQTETMTREIVASHCADKAKGLLRHGQFGALFKGIYANGVKIIVPMYSRDDEFEADRLGLLYMARAGYDPQAAIEVWKRDAARGVRRAGFMIPTPYLPNGQRPLNNTCQKQWQNIERPVNSSNNITLII